MMASTIPAEFAQLLHELAEGLQATGNYLDTARRLDGEDVADHASCIRMLEKAAGQLTRAQASYRQLREGLSEKP